MEAGLCLFPRPWAIAPPKAAYGPSGPAGWPAAVFQVKDTLVPVIISQYTLKCMLFSGLSLKYCNTQL